MTEAYRSSQNADLVRHCQAVLFSADGKPISEIAQSLGVDQSTIHRWIDRFESGGVEALATKWKSGRPPRWDEQYEVLLVENVRHDPRWYGLDHSVWTCSLLAGYLAQQTRISMSAERVRVLLHNHGIRLKQPTAVVHPPEADDPQYDPKGFGLR